MVAGLLGGAHVTADAGFVGHETWAAILGSGQRLLVRVAANVRLLQGLGYARPWGDGVYLWPAREAARGNPPLVLRLAMAYTGRHPVVLVTSVRDGDVRTDRQVEEVDALHWGLELFYHHYTQNYELRRLRSKTAKHAELGATWSLRGLSRWVFTRGWSRRGPEVPVSRVGLAWALLADLTSRREDKHDPDPGESLAESIGQDVIDP